MGYANIQNLYKDQNILLFKRCFCLEKIHGTSAHLSLGMTPDGEVHINFFAGGEKHEKFVSLFNQDSLKEKFKSIYSGNDIVVHGEAYGGKQQGMSATYGPNLKFIAFDVKVGENWVSIPHAETIVQSLGLEFIHYVETSTDLADLDRERDKESTQAIRNGMGPGKVSEGVVLRPLIEVRLNNGSRVCAKHKKAEFRETSTPREVDPTKMKVLEEANDVAEEYVVMERLNHVKESINKEIDVCNIPFFIKGMLEDIKKEQMEGEIVWTKDVEKAVGTKTAKLIKQVMQNSLVEASE